MFVWLGPVELAAAGVSIALFNQASRITIFPLVSITTSFVAEEDTIERMNIKASKIIDDAKLSEIETPKDQLLQDIENGETRKENIDVEKYAANNDTNVEDGTNFLLIISSHLNFLWYEKQLTRTYLIVGLRSNESILN